jgi:hypothetical protein
MSEHHHHGPEHPHAAPSHATRSHALAADPTMSVLRLSAGYRLAIVAGALAMMWLTIWQVLA